MCEMSQKERKSTVSVLAAVDAAKTTPGVQRQSHVTRLAPLLLQVQDPRCRSLMVFSDSVCHPLTRDSLSSAVGGGRAVNPGMMNICTAFSRGGSGSSTRSSANETRLPPRSHVRRQERAVSAGAKTGTALPSPR